MKPNFLEEIDSISNSTRDRIQKLLNDEHSEMIPVAFDENAYENLLNRAEESGHTLEVFIIEYSRLLEKKPSYKVLVDEIFPLFGYSKIEREHEIKRRYLMATQKDLLSLKVKMDKLIEIFDFPSDVLNQIEHLIQLMSNVSSDFIERCKSMQLFDGSGRFQISEKLKTEYSSQCTTYFTKQQVIDYVIASQFAQSINDLAGYGIRFIHQDHLPLEINRVLKLKHLEYTGMVAGASIDMEKFYQFGLKL